MDTHYYPQDIALALQARWPARQGGLPEPALLTQLISVAYQASLLSEEGRPVRCHLVFAPSDELRAWHDGPTMFHVLRFSLPRPCDEQEVRRLSPTVRRPGNLLAVSQTPDNNLLIWGMMLTRHEWDRSPESTLTAAENLPPALLVHVRGPGNLVFYCGASRILTLQQGRIEGHGFVQFPEAWARGHFTDSSPFGRSDAGNTAGFSNEAYNSLASSLALHIMRRSINRVRLDAHGGMLVLIPTRSTAEHSQLTGQLRPKYRMQGTTARPIFLDLLATITGRMAALGLESWTHYLQATDASLHALADEVDHFADLLADLMAVDGALVVTKNLEIIGFGAEIHAPLIPSNRVYRALNMEATTLQAEAPDRGGTRHRAAYRLCLADSASLVIVVSQDGGVKFVRQQGGEVVFWDQLAL
ncbi:putative sensor domain DACNV-containing protein [Hymenobacter sp. BRD67]|uniref:putative sensor domain DACNV-containing protein n=1 Tax=Hymenobacter sp. BRD67 TaxID=2675877 RepID=UPI0015653CD3|nr:diadenylate cyclase [Hymenobacter sp. BRD67]QKG52479.1 DNA integrity scanning protein DisA nucleotide-binding domain protein [Hymenobacter sp. BRD67]